MVSDRVWTALGSVRLVAGRGRAWWTAVFIGLGVWMLGVPFALPIAVLTFFGGFVPIVGAFVAGAVAILVALVSNGVWTAVAVLAIVLVVQQLEGNVMQPILVGRTLKIHAAVVLASVALGGTLFGIVGAFLAVPAVAAFQVIARYVREQLGQPRRGRPVGWRPAPRAVPSRPRPDAAPSGPTSLGARAQPERSVQRGRLDLRTQLDQVQRMRVQGLVLGVLRTPPRHRPGPAVHRPVRRRSSGSAWSAACSPVVGSPERTCTAMCMLVRPVRSSRASTSTMCPIWIGR